MTKPVVCSHCLVSDHRYGTSDPHHDFSYVACCNSLLGLIEDIGLMPSYEGPDYVEVHLNHETWNIMRRITGSRRRPELTDIERRDRCGAEHKDRSEGRQ